MFSSCNTSLTGSDRCCSHEEMNQLRDPCGNRNSYLLLRDVKEILSGSAGILDRRNVFLYCYFVNEKWIKLIHGARIHRLLIDSNNKFVNSGYC